MKILAIIQARMSSKRLPGKVCRKIKGKEMFLYQVERVLSTPSIDQVLLATSTEEEDNLIAEVCKREKIPCFRGDLKDVLDRFYQAASLHSPEHIIRLTADCPFSDPIVIEELIQEHINGGYDYSSNCRNNRTYPHGLDVEIFKYDVLKEYRKTKTSDYDREHVTPSMYREGTELKIFNLNQDKDQSQYRITVDYPEDFTVIEEILTHFDSAEEITTNDIINYLDANPSIRALNQKHQHN